MIERMPPGAISNPIRVPGGFQIVTLRQRRESGRDIATLLSVRQAFFPFNEPLNPERRPCSSATRWNVRSASPTGARSCEAVEQAARAAAPRQRPPFRSRPDPAGDREPAGAAQPCWAA